MSDRSKIEWCDATWNCIRGCVKVSPGCKNCYAETFAERFRGVKGHPYEQGFDLRLVPEKLDQPLRWKKPRKIFVNSMSDLFQDGVPDEFVDKVFAVMALAPQHTFQVLTKRAERMADYLGEVSAGRMYDIATTATKEFGDRKLDAMIALSNAMPNVLFGVSVENEEYACERLPHLHEAKDLAYRTFVSYEPALGPVDWEPWAGAIDWLISGGESGPGARPSHPDWHRSARDFCVRHGVPYFFKQWGSYRPICENELPTTFVNRLVSEAVPRSENLASVVRLNKRVTGSLIDGVEWKQFPEGGGG